MYVHVGAKQPLLQCILSAKNVVASIDVRCQAADKQLNTGGSEGTSDGIIMYVQRPRDREFTAWRLAAGSR